jgi:hypothetical protein
VVKLADMTVPATIFTSTSAATLRWNLPIAGATFEIRIKVFQNGYLITAPKVTTGTNPVHVMGIRVAVNGTVDPTGTTFQSVDSNVPAGTNPGIVLVDSGMVVQQSATPQSDKIHFEFDVLEAGH